MKKKRVKKDESQSVEEDPKKAARRERARLRREKAQREADEQTRSGNKPKKTSARLKSRRNPSEDGGSDQPSEKSSSRVSESETRRMKTVVSQDNILQLIYSDNLDDAKISLCNEHFDKLLERLRVHKIDGFVSSNLSELRTKLKTESIDPMHHSTVGLIRLALRSVGNEGVIQYRCPVCALQKFDYIAQVATLMKSALLRGKL